MPAKPERRRGRVPEILANASSDHYIVARTPDESQLKTLAVHLGELEQLLLFAVLRLGDGAYGNAIREEVEARTGRVLSPGAVYTVLDRLEAKGLVASEVTAATPARGGRRMRRYWMEPAGARALRDVYAGLRRMAQGLGPKLDDLAAEGGAGPARR